MARDSQMLLDYKYPDTGGHDAMTEQRCASLWPGGIRGVFSGGKLSIHGRRRRVQKILYKVYEWRMELANFYIYVCFAFIQSFVGKTHLGKGI